MAIPCKMGGSAARLGMSPACHPRRTATGPTWLTEELVTGTSSTTICFSRRRYFNIFNVCDFPRGPLSVATATQPVLTNVLNSVGTPFAKVPNFIVWGACRSTSIVPVPR